MMKLIHKPEEKSNPIDSAIQNSDENSSFSPSSVSDSEEDEEEDDDDIFQSGFIINKGKIKSYTPLLAKNFSQSMVKVKSKQPKKEFASYLLDITDQKSIIIHQLNIIKKIITTPSPECPLQFSKPRMRPLPKSVACK